LNLKTAAARGLMCQRDFEFEFARGGESSLADFRMRLGCVQAKINPARFGLCSLWLRSYFVATSGPA